MLFNQVFVFGFMFDIQDAGLLHANMNPHIQICYIEKNI